MATDLARFARSDVPRIRWTAVSGLSVLTAFVVGGLFEYNFGDSEVFMLFLFLISIPYGIARLRTVGEKPGRSPISEAVDRY
jgi:hypothetical protein